MNLKTIALVCSLAALTAPFAVRAADAPSTTAPAATPAPEGRRGGGREGGRELQSLTPEEQTKYKAAQETARKDPKVKAAQEKMFAAIKESREALDAAMIAADPSVEPLVKKVQEAREKAMAARRSGATQ